MTESKFRQRVLTLLVSVLIPVSLLLVGFVIVEHRTLEILNYNKPATGTVVALLPRPVNVENYGESEVWVSTRYITGTNNVTITITPRWSVFTDKYISGSAWTVTGSDVVSYRVWPNVGLWFQPVVSITTDLTTTQVNVQVQVKTLNKYQ